MEKIKSIKFKDFDDIKIYLKLKDGDLVFSTQNNSWISNLFSPSPIKHGSIYSNEKIYEVNEFGYHVENIYDYIKKRNIIYILRVKNYNQDKINSLNEYLKVDYSYLKYGFTNKRKYCFGWLAEIIKKYNLTDDFDGFKVLNKIFFNSTSFNSNQFNLIYIFINTENNKVVYNLFK